MDDGLLLTLPNAVVDVKNEQVRLQTALYSDIRGPRPAPIYLKGHFLTARGLLGHRILTSTVMIASNMIGDNTYLQKSWNIDMLWILQLQGLE